MNVERACALFAPRMCAVRKDLTTGNVGVYSQKARRTQVRQSAAIGRVLIDKDRAPVAQDWFDARRKEIP